MIAAVVPAAGRGQRMGRPKLLLPIEGQPLIVRVVTALRHGGADRVVVVAPPEASDEGPAVALAARSAGAEVVAPPERPAEMRDSIEIGLATAAKPITPGYLLIAPGDAPGITPGVVALVLNASALRPENIIVPSCGGRRGHPLVLPWKFAAEIPSLPAGQGVNALVARYRKQLFELALDDTRITEDLDSPEDYSRWNAASCVQVKFFALARDRAGCSEINLDLAGIERVWDLRAELARRLPGLAPLMNNVMIAVNEEYATDDAQIVPGARIAVIPPVSGGATVDARSSRAPAPCRRPVRP